MTKKSDALADVSKNARAIPKRADKSPQEGTEDTLKAPVRSDFVEKPLKLSSLS